MAQPVKTKAGSPATGFERTLLQIPGAPPGPIVNRAPAAPQDVSEESSFDESEAPTTPVSSSPRPDLSPHALNTAASPAETSAPTPMRVRKRRWLWLQISAGVLAGGLSTFLLWPKAEAGTTDKADSADTHKPTKNQQSAAKHAPEPVKTAVERKKQPRVRVQKPEQTAIASMELEPQAEGDGELVIADGDILPPDVNVPTLLHYLRKATRRAEKCHPGGRATGTASVYITFGPAGRVENAVLKGEPLQSAPVGACILAHARSIVIPKFEGQAFTIKRSITLR